LTRVWPERLVVTDRGITTTAAFSAMYDFALGLVREHHGPDVARVTARIALVDDACSTQTPTPTSASCRPRVLDSRAVSNVGSTSTSRIARTWPWCQSIRSIAAQAGYQDASTFARLFARHVGRSPRDYRQSFQRATT
jgi:transcriptional regulator GlxA family with amidase domain